MCVCTCTYVYRERESLQLNSDFSETELGDILCSGLSSSAFPEQLVYVFLVDLVKLEIVSTFPLSVGKLRSRVLVCLWPECQWVPTLFLASF